jgi:hypothetical protein
MRTRILLLAVLVALPMFAQRQRVARPAQLRDDGTTVTLPPGRNLAIGTAIPEGAPAGTIGASVIYSPNEALNVKAFGAKGDGTDESEHVQAALDAIHAAGGGKLWVPNGTYKVKGLNVYSDTEIECQSRAAIFRKVDNTVQVPVFYLNPMAERTADPANNAKNITLRNCTVEDDVAAWGFSEPTHLLYAGAVTNLRLENLLLRGWRGDAFDLSGDNGAADQRHNSQVFVEGCEFDGLVKDNRNGISVADVDGMVIRDNVFRNLSRSGMPGGIDLEPNFTFSTLRNVLIEGNQFSQIAGDAAINAFFPGSMAVTPTNITIRGNVVNDLGQQTYHRCFCLVAQEFMVVDNLNMAWRVEDNEVYDGCASEVRNIRGISITGNTFWRFTDRLLIATPNSNLLRAHSVLIHDNRFYGAGIHIGNVNGITITNNRFWKNTGTFGMEFYVPAETAAIEGVIITGNRFVKGTNQAKAVSLNGATLSGPVYANNSVEVGLTSDIPQAP